MAYNWPKAAERKEGLVYTDVFLVLVVDSSEKLSPKKGLMKWNALDDKINSFQADLPSSREKGLSPSRHELPLALRAQLFPPNWSRRPRLSPLSPCTSTCV